MGGRGGGEKEEMEFEGEKLGSDGRLRNLSGGGVEVGEVGGLSWGWNRDGVGGKRGGLYLPLAPIFHPREAKWVGNGCRVVR